VGKQFENAVQAYFKGEPIQAKTDSKYSNFQSSWSRITTWKIMANEGHALEVE
jgi:hypothetical protein